MACLLEGASFLPSRLQLLKGLKFLLRCGMVALGYGKSDSEDNGARHIGGHFALTS